RKRKLIKKCPEYVRHSRLPTPRMASDDFSASTHTGSLSLVPESQFALPMLYKQGAYDKVLVWAVSFDGECLVMQWGNTEQLANNSLQVARTKVSLDSETQSL